jgi:hypothetical protein
MRALQVAKALTTPNRDVRCPKSDNPIRGLFCGAEFGLFDPNDHHPFPGAFLGNQHGHPFNFQAYASAASRQLRIHGRDLRHLLILGTNQRAVEFARRIEANRTRGYHLLGFVDDDWPGIGRLIAPISKW